MSDSRLASNFVQAKNYGRGRIAPIRIVAVHTMECPENSNKAEWCAEYFAGKNAPIASAHYCLAPETKVLTRNLNWVAIGDLQEGSELWGTQETPTGMKSGRTYLPTTITKYKTRKAPCVKIVMEDGRSVVCSTDHKWLVKYPKGNVPWFWRDAGSLKEDMRILTPLDVWEPASTLDAAWLAGIYDGEGCASRNESNRGLTFAQKEGYVLDKAKSTLSDLKIPYRCDSTRDTGVVVTSVSGTRHVLRTLGMLQPVRLVRDREDFIAGRALKSRAFKNDLRIESIEYVGERDVVSIETDTHTFFAEGMVSHNCVDNDSVVQGVAERDTAYAAPGCNADGVQIEQAGYAGQSANDWQDAFSKAELDRTARLIADICVRNNIPIRHLTNAQLAAGYKGVIGHVQASQVYKKSDHSDPGSNFPWEQVIAAAQRYATGANPAIAKPEAPKATASTSVSTSTTSQSAVKVAVDGILGPDTIKASQRILGTPADGVISRPVSSFVKALQKVLNTKGNKLAVDGMLGAETSKAFQRYLGVTADGIIGKATVTAWQRKLNAGTFGK